MKRSCQYLRSWRKATREMKSLTDSHTKSFSCPKVAREDTEYTFEVLEVNRDEASRSNGVEADGSNVLEIVGEINSDLAINAQDGDCNSEHMGTDKEFKEVDELSNTSFCETDTEEEEPSLAEELSKWATEFLVKSDAIDSLLKILRGKGHEDLPTLDNTVEAVPSSWVVLNNGVRYCYWTANKTTARIRNLEHPSPDWSQHRVRLFKRQTEEYEEAKRLARQYLEDSQAESERKVKNNKRYLSSSDDEAGPCSTERKRVPVAKRPLLPAEPTEPFSRDVPVSMRTPLPKESLNSEDLNATSSPIQRLTEDQVAGNLSDVLMKTAQNTSIGKLLLTKIISLEERLLAIEKLLQTLASRQSESQVQDGLRLEPCKNMEEFTSLEANLQDKAYFQQAVRFLSLIGGRKVGDTTRRTMMAVANNLVWSGYSLYGKKQKAKLCELKIYKLVKRAVKTSVPDSTDKNVEVQIMEVLKHAPQKVRREVEAQNRTTQMEAPFSDED